MKRISAVSCVVVVLAALSVGACGGSNPEAKSPEGATGAKAELSAMDELKAIPEDLGKETDALSKPIDDANAALDELAKFPQKHKIDAKSLAAMAKVAVEGGEVKLDASAAGGAAANLSAEAKAEIEGTLKKLQGAVAQLKDTPAKASALLQKATAASAKVPLLATKVTTQANLVLANPFGNADGKAKAQADVASVQKVQADVSAKIGDAQKKVTEIPATATNVLAKVTASFTGGGGGGADTASAKSAKSKSAK